MTYYVWYFYELNFEYRRHWVPESQEGYSCVAKVILSIGLFMRTFWLHCIGKRIRTSIRWFFDISMPVGWSGVRLAPDNGYFQCYELFNVCFPAQWYGVQFTLFIPSAFLLFLHLSSNRYWWACLRLNIPNFYLIIVYLSLP